MTSKSAKICAAVARNLRTGSGVLSLLGRHPDPNIQWYVASNPNTPGPELERLADEACVGVRVQLAYRYGAQEQPELIEKLSGDKDPSVRRVVATMHYCTGGLLEKLSQDIDEGVLFAVATNPKTPRHVLAALCDSEYTSVRGYARAHLEAYGWNRTWVA